MITILIFTLSLIIFSSFYSTRFFIYFYIKSSEFFFLITYSIEEYFYFLKNSSINVKLFLAITLNIITNSQIISQIISYQLNIF